MRDNQHQTERKLYDLTQFAILIVIQALHGLVSEENVLQAIGDARSPTAVSRAVRTRISRRYF